MFETNILGDERNMYLSLITRPDLSAIEFYDMSSFCLSPDGYFEAAFAENSLAYWQDRKPEFAESGKVKLYQRKIRIPFFYPYLLNESSPDEYRLGEWTYSWEYETDISLPQLVFDKPASVRVLNESTVLADLLSPECERYNDIGGYAWIRDDEHVITAGSLTMQDGSILVVYKETMVWKNRSESVDILLYDKDGKLLDNMFYGEDYARIIRNTEQNYFEIHAWGGSQGWQRMDLSGKIRTENGKIVIEPDEEQGKEYVVEGKYIMQPPEGFYD